MRIAESGHQVIGEAGKLLRMIRGNKVMVKSGVRLCSAIRNSIVACVVTLRRRPGLVRRVQLVLYCCYLRYLLRSESIDD
jgi:hypothetical protein